MATDGGFTLNLVFDLQGTLPAGGHPVVLTLYSNSANTPDQRASDNSGVAVICVRNCSAPASYTNKVMVPVMRR